MIEKPISRQRRWQMQREAEGLCRQCGDRVKPGRKQCRVCLAKALTRTETWREQQVNKILTRELC